LYGVEACATNSAEKQSLQITKKKVINKISGAMVKESYMEVNCHFGIYTLQQSIALRGDSA